MNYLMNIDELTAGLDMTPYLGPIGHSSAMEKPLREWNQTMEIRTDLLFATGSRDNVRWQRLAKSTKASRNLAGVQGSDPLNVSGGLRKSVKSFVGRDQKVLQAVVYTVHPLAKIHHFGAHVPAHTVRAKGKALRFTGTSTVGAFGPQKPGDVVFAKKVDIPAFDIPSRPILFISERDRNHAVSLVRDHRLKMIQRLLKEKKERMKAKNVAARMANRSMREEYANAFSDILTPRRAVGE